MGELTINGSANELVLQSVPDRLWEEDGQFGFVSFVMNNLYSLDPVYALEFAAFIGGCIIVSRHQRSSFDGVRDMRHLLQLSGVHSVIGETSFRNSLHSLATNHLLSRGLVRIINPNAQAEDEPQPQAPPNVADAQQEAGADGVAEEVVDEPPARPTGTFFGETREYTVVEGMRVPLIPEDSTFSSFQEGLPSLIRGRQNKSRIKNINLAIESSIRLLLSDAAGDLPVGLADFLVNELIHACIDPSSMTQKCLDTINFYLIDIGNGLKECVQAAWGSAYMSW